MTKDLVYFLLYLLKEVSSLIPEKRDLAGTNPAELPVETQDFLAGKTKLKLICKVRRYDSIK